MCAERVERVFAHSAIETELCLTLGWFAQFRCCLYAFLFLFGLDVCVCLVPVSGRCCVLGTYLNYCCEIPFQTLARILALEADKTAKNCQKKTKKDFPDIFRVLI